MLDAARVTAREKEHQSLFQQRERGGLDIQRRHRCVVGMEFDTVQAPERRGVLVLFANRHPQFFNFYVGCELGNLYWLGFVPLAVVIALTMATVTVEEEPSPVPGGISEARNIETPRVMPK